MLKIIAEAGCNWSTMDEAKKFIDESKRLGLFATKFQIYSKREIEGNPNYEFLKTIQIGVPECIKLSQYAKSINQRILFTPMYDLAVSFTKTDTNDYIKIRHKDQNNLNLLECITYYNYEKTCFISTDYPNFFSRLGFLPFYCIPKYPATFEDYKWIMRKFEDTHYRGISDHTPTTKMLEYFLEWDKRNLYRNDVYFEKHVCLTKDCLEADWSVTFEELQEALEVIL